MSKRIRLFLAAIALIAAFESSTPVEAKVIQPSEVISLREITPIGASSIPPQIRPALDLLSPDALAEYRGLVSQINAARLFKDREALLQIESRVQKHNQLEGVLATFLSQRIGEALAEVS